MSILVLRKSRVGEGGAGGGRHLEKNGDLCINFVLGERRSNWRLFVWKKDVGFGEVVSVFVFVLLFLLITKDSTFAIM